LFEEGTVNKTPQNHDQATHTKMLNKEFGRIDFNQSSQKIHDLVRGLNPWPIAFTNIGGEVIKIYKTLPIDTTGKVGEILSADPKNGLIIACATGAIKVLELQRQGGKRLSAEDFLRGYKIEVGSVIDD
jgi:methionyl-tRNA formyltransferase